MDKNKDTKDKHKSYVTPIMREKLFTSKENPIFK